MFEFDGNAYTLAEMIEANADDAALCGWLMASEVGDVFDGCVRIS